ncbi:MAG TPA: UDP-N-acetylmuramoyl-L-alanine--D-glutamate ligase [Acidimicrobiales bacterium]|nr:UDP-N-acetylmuramoyl-L-alanine--D-glutamate ligase [Acidimicrobiales bacterium]
MERALVIGLGAAAEPAVRHLDRRGFEVRVVEDSPSEASRARAGRLGVELLVGLAPDAALAGVDLVVPSPSVPFAHPALRAASDRGLPVWSEFELFARWDTRPAVAITGTNGKTTVTTLVEAILVEAGRRAVACGNNDLPLLSAMDDETTELFVVEASSFRLAFTDTFRPVVGTWLNLSPDHLDWHPSFEHYAQAKFRIWANQAPTDVAVANADDPDVLGFLDRAPGRRVTFGLASPGGYRVEAGGLLAPDGRRIVGVDELPRRLPHDLANHLAAAATAMEAGAPVDACREVLTRFEGLPHRVAFVRDTGGVRWYDDSKATTPASVVTAASGFESVVLIAGGRNKGLDLGVLREVAERLRAVVAIGSAAGDVESAFQGAVPVEVAGSMEAAVAIARRLARPGDVVLLSPGCTSFDWYANYAERGDHFARLVRELETA